MADAGRKHHELGFSKWPMFLSCPSFEPLESSAEAEAGTAKHVDFEESLNEANTGVPALHSTDGAKWAAAYVSSIAAGAEIYSETKVSLDIPAFGRAFGYCDAWLTRDGVLHVFDYKSGAPTDLDMMPQVMGYAYALCKASMDADNPYDRAVCYLLYGATHEVVRREADLAELERNAVDCIGARRAMRGRASTCGAACRYCRLAATCPSVCRQMEAVGSGSLSADMGDASRYALLSSMKGVIDAELERLKDAAMSKGGVLDDGKVRYVAKQSKGRAQSVNIVGLWQALCDRDVLVEQADVMNACSMTKDAFKKLASKEAKAAGVKQKELDEMYERNATYGAPVVRLVRADAERSDGE